MTIFSLEFVRIESKDIATYGIGISIKHLIDKNVSYSIKLSILYVVGFFNLFKLGHRFFCFPL